MVGIWGWAWALCGLVAAEQTPQRFEYERIEMGIPFKIVLYAADETTANRAADAAWARIHELNAIFSDYDPESECNRLSHSSPHESPVKVGPDMLSVLTFGQHLAQESDGAFDMTIGPVVRLWRRARRRHELPAEDKIKEALAATGYRNVELDEKNATVRLTKANMRLDFGGIAAGYAVDEAQKVLRKQGITSAMIDASGDIGVTEPPPGKPGWRIGVGKLDKPGESVEYVWLKNAALTTSGDAFQFLEINGVRYSHLVNPKIGVGLTEHSSVTVIAPDCITADSYTKPVAVLGAEAGFKIIDKKPGVAAFVMRKPADKLEITKSSRWSEYADKK